LYYKGYTFEEVMEFVLECLADGIIGYQGPPTDKYLDDEFILCVACISKHQSSQNLHEKHHPVCLLSKDYHEAIKTLCTWNVLFFKHFAYQSLPWHT